VAAPRLRLRGADRPCGGVVSVPLAVGVEIRVVDHSRALHENHRRVLDPGAGRIREEQRHARVAAGMLGLPGHPERGGDGE
jgi:hypothetical protein